MGNLKCRTGVYPLQIQALRIKGYAIRTFVIEGLKLF